MDKIQIRITDEQLKFLRSLNGNVSEHIRRAIDEYRRKIELESVSKTPKNG